MPVGVEAQRKLYICPGETRPISRSVHLSRLAAFFPACRECPFRTDTGQLSRATVERLQLTEHRVERESLFIREGVRGAYINELTRSKAGRMAAALARLLWQESPLIGHADPIQQGHRPRRPAVVIGHDERPSSPDIVTGVAASLRRMGCQVIDISLTTKPCFWFTVDHLQADAGVFVTGAGSPPSWTGLDFAGRHGAPLSQRPESAACCESSERLDLNRIEDQLRQPFSRSTRHAGPYRTFQALVPYEAGLWKHFHALRPLTVACACPNRLTRRTLERIFETLPCQLKLVDVPHRVRDPLDADDADIKRLSQAVRQRQADLGVLIDEDSQRCGFVDERGKHVPSERMTQLLCQLMLSEQPGETVAIETSTIESVQPFIEQSVGTAADAGETMAEMSQNMREQGAIIGGENSGRLWFREACPTSDAVITLAHVLALLSRSDTPLSEIAHY
jgi:phosphomannomutase